MAAGAAAQQVGGTASASCSLVGETSLVLMLQEQTTSTICQGPHSNRPICGRSGLLLSDDDLASDLGLLNINPNEPPPSSSFSTPTKPTLVTSYLRSSFTQPAIKRSDVNLPVYQFDYSWRRKLFQAAYWNAERRRLLRWR